MNELATTSWPDVAETAIFLFFVAVFWCGWPKFGKRK